MNIEEKNRTAFDDVKEITFFIFEGAMFTLAAGVFCFVVAVI